MNRIKILATLFLVASLSLYGGIRIGLHTPSKPITEQQSAPIQHHYILKQDPPNATILRLDTDTGDVCWIQLSVRDQNMLVPICGQ